MSSSGSAGQGHREGHGEGHREGHGQGQGIGAAIVGFFAVCWFAWGSSEPTPPLITALVRIGTVAGLVIIVLGVRRARSSPPGTSLMADPNARRRYAIIVIGEFVLIGIGSALLGANGGARWIPVWVCLGVGVHFFPLAPVVGDRRLVLLGVALIGVAALALALGLTADTRPATVTGLGAGLCLLVWAGWALRAEATGPGRP
jgi:hypothetical protein